MNNKSHLDIKKHYSEWLNSSKALEEIKEKIVKVGYPLELSVRDILRNRHYEVSNAFYEQSGNREGGGVWREIDIYASKNILRYTSGCYINFHILVIGECKYSSTNDFFAFEKEGEILELLPILFNSKSVLNGEGEKSRKADKHFDFPVTIENISEVDVKNSLFHPKNLIIYEASEQIVNSFAYFQQSYRENVMKENYIKIDAKIKKHLAQTGSGDLKSDMNSSSNFLIKDIGKVVENIEIVMAVPIIIVGENNGLIRVKINQGSVEDLVDIGYGIYLFVPSVITPNIQEILSESKKFPIILCNLSRLDDCLARIDKGFQNVVSDFMNRWLIGPYSFYSEVKKFVDSIPQNILDTYTSQQS